MLKLERVLVVLDPDSTEQPALDKVLALAKRSDFDITLLSCEYTQYLVEGYYFDAVDLPTLRQELLDTRKDTLERLAGPLREAGLNVQTLAVWGHPAHEAIVREALRLGADLVVQHTRQHSAVSRLILSHNDWQLIRTCPVPLLLVKEKPWKETPAMMAAVDPMHARHKPAGLDHRILSIAGDFAGLLGGEVFAVHAYSGIPLTASRQEAAKKAHEAAFGTLAEEFDIPRDHRFLTDEAPEFSLAQLQRDLQADIVFMGAVSRSMLSDVFIGSTTEKVLDFLECDVLLVKPADFVSPIKPA